MRVFGKVILASALVATSLSAVDIGLYAGVGASVFEQADKKIKGIQPSDELVGDGKYIGEIKFGAHFSQIIDGLDAKAFVIAYGRDQRNSEFGGGIGAEVEYRPFDSFKSLGFIFGLDSRYGLQDTYHEEKTVSSRVIGHDRLGAGTSRIEFRDDTGVSSTSLSLGVAYHFTKHLSVDLAYILRHETYEVRYRDLNTGRRFHTDWSENQNGARLGLNFYF